MCSRKAARTKREGGEKSPGRPAAAVPVPKDLSSHLAPLARRHRARQQVDVVVEVLDLPGEVGRVGQHADLVVVDADLALVDDLDDALGNAATVVFALTLFITCITFFVFRRSARKSGMAPAALRSMPFVPTGLRIATLNTLLMFGAFVAAAVLWQRFVGTVSVSPMVATLVVAVTAMAATAFAELRTKREMLSAGAATA